MVKPRSFLRCVSFCTARSYDLPRLANSIKRKDYFSQLGRDVLQVADFKKSTHIFFFNHGSFICWGLNKRQETKWVEYVKEFATDPLTRIETDHFCFQFGEEVTIDSHERFKIDVITLDSDNPQIKLALSYGLAQSVKLEAFEDAIQETVQINSFLPEEIATRGTISLSRRAIFKRMGEIFIARSSINLSSEYLDTPEFFWRNPNLEPFYIMVKKFLDLPSRVMALNQKLDVLQELLHMLDSQLQHQHSSLLETIIILLIFVEILITVFNLHIW